MRAVEQVADLDAPALRAVEFVTPTWRSTFMAATGAGVIVLSPDLELALRRDLLVSGHAARKHAQSMRELHAFLTR